ncbi:D-alanine--D-alanine ligase [candidate division KSB1 bacterium]|nr:D-alanine--D-alanine ligase [candidate division KSB1 bacterium]
MVSRLLSQELLEDEDEPPPDLLAECDSEETILAITQALARRWKVYPVESDEYAYKNLQALRPHLVFNIAERVFGPNRESHIPTICEMLGIPYTGSDALTLGICLDKSRAKEILTFHKIPNAAFWMIESADQLSDDILFPVIIKPLYEGSSKGIKDNSVVHDHESLCLRVEETVRLYKQPVIIEHFLTGREFTVGILGNWPDIEILPIVEIDYSELPNGANPIYSYEAKWVWDQPDHPLQIFKCPASISQDLSAQIEQLVLRVCKVLRLKDWCRIDIRLDDNNVANVLEINPLPGILPNLEDNSCLPKAARAAGYSYEQLIQKVVEIAAKRYGITV